MRILIKLLLRVLFTLLFRVRVRGDWQALKQERVLVVANHESFLDGMLLGIFMPGNPVFVVHTWVAEYWLFKPLLALVDRTGPSGGHIPRRPPDGHRPADEDLSRPGLYCGQDWRHCAAGASGWSGTHLFQPHGRSLSASLVTQDAHHHHAD